MTRAGRDDDGAVVLAGFDDAAVAQRLVDRLTAEGLGAQVWPAGRAAALLPADQPPLGSTVVVRHADHGDARILATLFDEIDRGVSRVAPPPSGLWHGKPNRQLLGVGVIAVLVVAVLVAVVAALAM